MFNIFFINQLNGHCFSTYGVIYSKKALIAHYVGPHIWWGGGKMKCPLCGNLDDRVIESRQNISGTSIRRRRECASCAYRFTSYEKVEEVPLMVVKRDNTRHSETQNNKK